MVYGSRHRAHGSRLMAKGAGPAQGPRGAQGLGPDLGARPQALGLGSPQGLGHALTIDNRLIN